MITFKCSGCGNKLSVKEELAGQKGKCPSCKQLLVVPAATPGMLVAGSKIAKDAAAPPEAVAALVRAIHENALLEPARLEELTRDLLPRYTEAKALAKDLIQRGWMTPFQINQLLQGRGKDLVLGQYVILERLGEGGMGAVFKARHRRLDRIDALKVIRKEHLANATSIQRFQQEAKAAAHVSHTNIVAVHDADEAGGTHFLVMEYVEGTDLSKLVKEGGPLPIAQACAYIRQAALGLQHAHERGLIHRDIKPSNLFVTHFSPSGRGDGGTVKILDMGLARLNKNAQDSDAGGLTQTGAVMGTPDYIAPEQAMNSRQVDIRADLYSLGCTLYFLLTGQPPFPGGDLMQKLLAHQMQTPAPVEQLRPEVPPELAALLRRLMAKKPEDRYQTPAELVHELEPFSRRFEDDTIPIGPHAGIPRPLSLRAQPAGVLGALRRLHPLVSTKRRRWITAAVALVMFCFLAILVARTGRGTAGKKQTSKEDQEAAAKAVEEKLPWKTDDVLAMLGSHRLQHWGPVRSVAVSPDGRLIASGGDDALVQLWEASTGKLVAICKVENVKGKAVNSIAFAPDGKTLIAGSQDGQVAQWHTATAKESTTFMAPGAVSVVAFAPDGLTAALACAGEYENLKLWKPGTEKQGAAFRMTQITALAFAPNGKTLALARGAVISLFSLAEGKIATIFPGHQKEGITSLSYSPDGSFLTSAGVDGTVYLWDIASQKKLAVLKGHDGKVLCVAFAPDGRSVVSGGQDGSVKIWDVSAHVLRYTLQGHQGPVLTVAFASDGKTIVSGSADNTVRVWDVATRKEKFPKVHEGPVTCVAFAPDGNLLISGGDDQIVKFWDPANKTDRPASEPQGGKISAVAFSPDGQTLASGCQDGTLKLWDPETAKVRSTLPGHKGPISTVVFTVDGKTLVSASLDGVAKLWDASSGKLKNSVFQDGGIQGLAISSDGSMLATTSQFTTKKMDMKLWDAATGKERSFYHYDGGPGKALAFVPNGKNLVGGCDKRVLIWQPDGKIQSTLQGHAALVTCVAFSADGKTLASAGLDGRIILWNFATNQKLQEWPMPGAVHGLAFASDGRRLASANADGTVFIFRLSGTSAKASK